MFGISPIHKRAVRRARHLYSTGGSGEYFGDNNAYLGRVNVFHHVAAVETRVGAAAYLLRKSIPTRQRYIAAKINLQLYT